MDIYHDTNIGQALYLKAVLVVRHVGCVDLDALTLTDLEHDLVSLGALLEHIAAGEPPEIIKSIPTAESP